MENIWNTQTLIREDVIRFVKVERRDGCDMPRGTLIEPQWIRRGEDR